MQEGIIQGRSWRVCIRTGWWLICRRTVRGPGGCGEEREVLISIIHLDAPRC